MARDITTKVNGHEIVRIYTYRNKVSYVCINCTIRGPYIAAFEDINECESNT